MVPYKLDVAHLPDLLPLIAALMRHVGDEGDADAEMLARCLSSGLSFGYGIGAPMAGYALCSVRPRIGQGTLDLSLDHIYIDAAHRRSGLGRRLIDRVEAEAACRGCARVIIGAHLTNDAARDAYLALGYEMKEVRFRGFTKAPAP